MPSHNISIRLRYKQTNNFMGKRIYHPQATCAVHPITAKKLSRASRKLAKRKPGYKLVLWDCFRSIAIQKRMYEMVKGTSKQRYVAKPKPPNYSMHNKGCAVDATLADASGKLLDMGTDFDHFGPLAQPRLEKKMLAKGKLTAAQIANRKLLRDVMQSAGMRPLSIEWWHFGCLRKSKAAKLPAY